MARQILDQHISKQKDGTYHARVEVVEDDGERASLSDNFASFDEANQYVTAVENGLDILPDGTIPEPPNMTPEQAEVINSNVNPAPAPNGATRIPNGEQAGVDLSTSAADTQQPPTSTDTSNEVAGAQDANAEPSDSAQQPDQAAGQGSSGTSTPDGTDTTSDTTDNSKESKSDAGSSKKGKSSKSN